ncbi:MAG: cupin domain-containing protein [Bacteriovoracaceae bacterium]
MNEVEKIIQQFELTPHPEGGFFKETYRSNESYENLGHPYEGSRFYSTAIYFLLPQGHKSALHRISSDEIWHFHLGGPMELVQISPSGELERIIIGPDFERGQKLQHVVPAGFWFGGSPLEGSEFSFVGCTVSPGFDFQDFELGGREKLLSSFPEHSELIHFYTSII